MVQLNGMDHSTNTAIFSISAVADISSLPTTTAAGSWGNETFPPVKAGSWAYLTDGSGKKYVLDGATDTWKENA
jgi:hypothetical protein